MFLHNLKYEFKTTICQKDIVFWVILFPIILGTLFKVAFGNISEESRFTGVDVAVVYFEDNEIFQSVINEVSTGDDALFNVTQCDEQKALKLLEERDVEGIIYADKLSFVTYTSGINQTIVKSFLEQYNSSEAVIKDTIKTNPQKLSEVSKALSTEVVINNDIKLTDGNWDEMINYFYNLIAMTGLFCSYIGVSVCVKNQANISDLGARKCASPVKKSVSTASSLCAAFLVCVICMVICVSFLRFGLNIYFGNRLLIVYLTAILSGMIGLGLGFFVGAIGKMKESTKIGILTCVSLGLCFFSGLMANQMKGFVENVLPIFNDLNPSALITDAFYCLNIYSDYRVFGVKILSMLIECVVFFVGGFFLTRKRKYDSL